MTPWPRLRTLVTLVSLLCAAPAAAQWQANGVRISINRPGQENPFAVSDGAGGTIVAWASGVTGFLAQRVSADGTPLWTAGGVEIVAESSIDTLLGMVPDGQGGAYVFWRSESFALELYAQHVNGAGVTQWGPLGSQLCASCVLAGGFDAVPDGVGGAIATWDDDRFFDQQYDIYAQRISESDSAMWGLDGVEVCTDFTVSSGPRIASDGTGGAYIVWNDDRSGGGDIYGQRVSAAGGTLIPNGFGVCQASDLQQTPDIASDGAGGAIVTWTDSRSAPPKIYAQRILFSTGLWPFNGVSVCTGPGTQSLPRIAADGGGGAVVTWQDMRGGDPQVFLQHLDADGDPVMPPLGSAATPIEVTEFPNDIIADGTGGAIVAWTDPETSLRAQRLSPIGDRLWYSEGEMVCPNPGNGIGAVVVPDGAGGALIVWRDQRRGSHPDSADIYAQRVDAAGVVGPAPAGGWEPGGAPVSTEPGIQRNPAITSNTLGGAILAWEDYPDSEPGLATAPGGHDESPRLHGPGRARIISVGLDDQGAVADGWSSTGVELAPTNSNQIEPVVAADDAGGAITAWTDDRNSNLDIYAQRVTADGSIASGWPPQGAPACSLSGNQQNAVVVEDGAGGAFIFWEDARGGAFDIYGTRLTALGTLAGGWPAGGLAVCTATGDQVAPAAVADGAGGAIVCWSDGRSGAADVYAQRVNANGTLAWAANGVALCTASGVQSVPAITSDGLGGAIVTWEDARSDSADIYARRVLASGSATWTANGVPLCVQTGRQRAPSIVTDGAGGAIVGWEDGRPNGVNGYDIRAQRVTDAGAIASGWIANGVALCTAPGDQLGVTLVADGLGGAIATWEDGRAVKADIYATQVLASGAMDPRYPVNGTPLTQANGEQVTPAITSDGSGGAIVGWTDGRGADTDIYAMHIAGPHSQSVTAVGPRPHAPSLVLMAPRPNPARSAVTFAFELAEAGPVRLEILDIAGRRVRRLVGVPLHPAGRTTVRWEGRDHLGNSVQAGVYFVRLVASGTRASRCFVKLQ